MNQSDTPKCDKCKSSFNMVNHDGEWICHSTHRLTELEEAVETKNMALETLSAIKEKYGLGSRNVMKELQCKVAELQKILNDCLYAMPCSYVPNHTVENLPAMIQNQTAMFAEEITRGESLEQQRDKAREQANHMREKWLAKGQCCEHLGAELHEARRERDEARKDAATWKSLFSAMERAGAEQSRRADENKLTTAAVTEQRDEARADAEKAKAEMVERYIVSIQQEHDRWNAFREYAMDRQQFILVARYGDVCDALKMAMDQARKILLPNADGDGRSEPAPSRQ